ncbi:MAG: alpha/beta hydrolase family protein [Kordiimonas sp.]
MTKFRPPAIPVGQKTQMGRISQLLYPHASKPNVTVIFILLISFVLAVHALTQAAHGQAEITEPCTADNITRVAAGNECLVIKTDGEPAERTSLVIFIHGDGYRRDPADYGPSDYMYRAARKHAAKGVVAVGLIRPGYFDSKGNSSTGNSYRSGDNYRPDVIAAVGAAVKTLKKHYKADTVVLVGHSGGAAISGVILGKYSGLVDAAVLGACPCNIPEWRILNRGHNNWTRSLSPHDYIDKTDKNIKVIAITGAEDGNTKSILAQNYIASLRENEIDASFIEVPEVGHNGIVKTIEFETAINEILEAQQ